MTKAEVRVAFPRLLATWRALPANAKLDEQSLVFSDFHNWLLAEHPEATSFRSVGGASDAIERWFDQATRQTWRN